jgi:hypothetical protein
MQNPMVPLAKTCCTLAVQFSTQTSDQSAQKSSLHIAHCLLQKIKGISALDLLTLTDLLTLRDQMTI